MTRRKLGVLFVSAAAVAAIGTAGASADNESGFKTGEPSMLTEVMDDVEITPLLTVGDELNNGYRFESIPDGISVRTRGQGRVDLFVNHETSKVPFPYQPALWQGAPGKSQNDFDNAQVSRLILNQHSAGVLNGSLVIPSSLGYQRFCSNYLATAKEGFDRDILFTNEESPDYVLRQEASWFVGLTDPAQREAGLVVALDVQTGKRYEIPGMGRHNHENSVAIPEFEDLVMMSGDDTFTSGPLTTVTFPTGITAPAQSQLYSYIAPDTKSVLADKGKLWAFVSDTPGVTSYYHVVPGAGPTVTGHFIEVPRIIARGIKPDGSELKSTDMAGLGFGTYPPPPSNGSWQSDLRTASPNVAGIDGPQWVLEYWSQINNVFDFVRVEDIAYDKRPDMGNIVYIVDSGRGRTAAQSLDTPNFRSTNGRVWKMVLDPSDPTVVTSLTVLVEGDNSPVKTRDEIHQPDNLESTPSGLLVTEDPGSSQQFTPDQQRSDAENATTARLWYVQWEGDPEVVVKVDQDTADEGPTDVDPEDVQPVISPAFPVSPGNWGAWETSGIVDASAAFGPGAFLIDVQAHTLWIDGAAGLDTPFDTDTVPDYSFKREGGQLLLLRIPGL